MDALPAFRYHPDPVSTGNVATAPDTPCLCCSRLRGYVYTGPIYSELFPDLKGCICPWCIADGSAAKRFHAEFTDTGALGDVPATVLEELGCRTPGFEAWQQEHWLTCCGDATAFSGLFSGDEVAQADPAVKKAVIDSLCNDWGASAAEAKQMAAQLRRDDGPTAYVFRCLHCARYLAYVDEP